MLRSSVSGHRLYEDRKDLTNIFEEIIIVIIFTALAAVTRLWRLGDWSLWADEIFSVQDAQQFPDTLTINPVAYMMIHTTTDIFGVSEWSARLGPCIIGILGIPFIYVWARKMFDVQVGIVASLLLAIHPWHIFWSQNARAYSLAFLFGGMSAFLFYQALEKDSGGLALLSLLSAILSISSCFQTILLLPALFAYIILLLLLPVSPPKGLNGKNLLIFFGPFILALASLFLPSVRDYLYSGWGSNEWGRSYLYILFTLVYSVGIPVSVAAFVGGIYSLTYLHRGGLFLICYAIVPLLLLLAISPFLNVAGYYLFFITPAYLILASLCAEELMFYASKGSKFLSSAVVLILAISLLSGDYLYFMVENGGREKWREAFQSLEQRIEPDAIVVISMPRVAEYYLKRSSIMQLEDVIARLGMLKDSWHENNQSVWFVLDEPSINILDPNRSFREWLYSNCRLVQEFPVYARVKDRTINLWRLTQAPQRPVPDFHQSLP